MPVKTVIQREALWLSLVWDGTNLEEFKSLFKRFDFNTLERKRIVAIPSKQWPPLDLSDPKLECISISIDDVLIKSLHTGEVKKLSMEEFTNQFIHMSNNQSESNKEE